MENFAFTTYTPVTVENLEAAQAWFGGNQSRPVAVLTADQHLRSTQYGNSDRSEDFKNAALHKAFVARTLGVPILDAGDLLDTSKIDAKVGGHLGQLNEALSGTKFYGTSGNHETSNPHWLETIRQMMGPERCNMHFLDNQIVTLPGGERVLGLPFLTKAGWESKRAEVEKLDIDILVVHAAVHEFCVDIGGARLGIDDFRGVKAKMVHLGDIHVCQYMLTPEGMIIGYPGSGEFAGRGEDIEKWTVILGRSGKDWVLVRFKAPTRRVFALRIDSEETLQAELERVAAARDENPIVLVRYAQGMQNVQARFSAVVDPTKAHVRCAPDPSTRRVVELGRTKGAEIMEGGAVDSEGFPVVRLQDLVESYIPVSHPFYKLALELCEPVADPARIIEAAVQVRKKELSEIEQAEALIRKS